jgi:hypothetical protein
MELPNELKNRQWAHEYLAEIEKMSDEELFEETFDAQVPDDYDGCWTTRGYWQSIILREYLREKFFMYKNLSEKNIRKIVGIVPNRL